MKRYNATCPLCNTRNRNLYLELTDGFFRCRACKKEVVAEQFECVETRKPNVHLKKISIGNVRRFNRIVVGI